MACFPLKVGDDVLGAVAIHKLLVQKPSFRAIDFEMFELIGSHAATALDGATMYSASKRKRPSAEGAGITLLKPPS